MLENDDMLQIQNELFNVELYERQAQARKRGLFELCTQMHNATMDDVNRLDGIDQSDGIYVRRECMQWMWLDPKSKVDKAFIKRPPGENRMQLRKNPRELPKWAQGSKLGSGAYGTVWLAGRSGLQDDEYAVKDQCMTCDLVREIKVLQSLAGYDHPFILRREAIMSWNQCYGSIVLSYYEDSLDDIVTRRYNSATMPLLLAKLYLVQVLLAVEFLHKLNFLHLDIKPANVFVREGFKTVLADFGKVVKLQDGQDFRELVSAHGTRAYMAPEMREARIAGRFSDMYSFGVMAWAISSENTQSHIDLANDSLEQLVNLEQEAHRSSFANGKISEIDRDARIGFSNLILEMTTASYVDRNLSAGAACRDPCFGPCFDLVPPPQDFEPRNEADVNQHLTEVQACPDNFERLYLAEQQRLLRQEQLESPAQEQAEAAEIALWEAQGQ